MGNWRRERALADTRHRIGPRRWLAAAFAATLAVQSALAPAAAQGRSVPLVRDAEIEALMRDYARPILRAAGLNAPDVEIALINDRSFNAFVANGQRIFLNTGVISRSETPGEVIGVIAHETGHIAGGHLSRLRQQLERANLISVVAMLAGVGAMAGAASGGSSGAEIGQMGQAMMMGSRHALTRSMLSYQRGEEATADQAAINYLNATGQSAAGMLKTFERLAGDSMFLSSGNDPYARSHPMPRDRIAALETLARRSPHFGKAAPPALQLRHDLARAKIAGFMEGPQAVARDWRGPGLPGRYARAIAAFRFGNPDDAVRQIDGLIAEQPNNAYFWELKGQALTEMGRPQQAVEPLRRAVALAPNEGLIRIALGLALVSGGSPAQIDEAIVQLTRGVQAEPESSSGFQHLARAYGRKGDIGHAELATARGLFAAGDFEQARQHAGRAQQRLANGSPAWLQAEDIMNHRPPRRR